MQTSLPHSTYSAASLKHPLTAWFSSKRTRKPWTQRQQLGCWHGDAGVYGLQRWNSTMPCGRHLSSFLDNSDLAVKAVKANEICEVIHSLELTRHDTFWRFTNSDRSGTACQVDKNGTDHSSSKDADGVASVSLYNPENRQGPGHAEPVDTCTTRKITLPPTMTFRRFVTGKSSGILSDISSGIRSGILSGISSGILPGISSGISSDISSDILSGILSGKSSGILSGKHSGTLSGIPCGILSGISELILSGISSGILSGISSDILSGVLSGISSGILSDMLSGVLSGISSGILSGRWRPVVLTELGRSQAEVQRCSLSSEGPRLRSSGAHSYRTPAVEVQQCPLHAEVGEELARRTAVEVQQCPLHAEVGEELARRKWTWKWM